MNLLHFYFFLSPGMATEKANEDHLVNMPVLEIITYDIQSVEKAQFQNYTK